MKVALIGAGRIGRLHGTVLAGHPDVDEVLVHDVVPETAEEAAGAFGGRVCATAEEAIDRADAVVIAANTHAHAPLVRSAVEAGRPTFVEKPLAFGLEESEALVELVERTGAILQVGFQRRFDAAYREAARLVAAGELGTVYLVRLIAHDDAPPPESYIPTSGGLFRDSSIHDFDAIRFVTGREVDGVVAVGSVRVAEVFARYDDVDTAGAILTMDDGSLGVLSQTRHNPRGYDIRMEVIGSGDAVSVGFGDRTPSRSLEPGAPAAAAGWDGFLSRFAGAYRAELEAFVRVAHAEAPSPCTARDGLEAMRIAAAATLSAREHRTVRLTEIARSTSPTSSGAERGR
ncbi:MAG TPA: Gfo/Idh/MocA family oxidoreductase [Candidatus Limnocylindrales bacterium]|nr:Gfo/Idh/MocA family oxidoreductase [Candidatus Limnocylindrales bacterium]